METVKKYCACEI